jgi:cryptochrome
LPVLAKMPDKYIYEPWKAPLDVQRAAGCIIGKDYPAPIVDHETASKANMDKHAKAYAAHKAAHGGGGDDDDEKPSKKAKK